MVTPKQLRRLATHPQDLIRFQQTGRLPQGVKPQSPLLTLLDQIGARDRSAFRGLIVDERLGYAGRRTFHNAEQAMNWLRPQPEMFDRWPAESWRIKAFSKVLHLEDLLECVSSVPESALERLRHLRRASARPPRP